jgi:hypothetical protein
MSPVLNLLQTIRRQPAMYLGKNSLAKLATFLQGYSFAIKEFGIASNDTFLNEFRDWVQNRFQIRFRSWDQIIEFHSVDDEEAMKCFWDLLDEFLAEKNIVHSKS